MLSSIMTTPYLELLQLTKLFLLRKKGKSTHQRLQKKKPPTPHEMPLKIIVEETTTLPPPSIVSPEALVSTSMPQAPNQVANQAPEMLALLKEYLPHLRLKPPSAPRCLLLFDTHRIEESAWMEKVAKAIEKQGHGAALTPAATCTVSQIEGCMVILATKEGFLTARSLHPYTQRDAKTRTLHVQGVPAIIVTDLVQAQNSPDYQQRLWKQLLRQLRREVPGDRSL